MLNIGIIGTGKHGSRYANHVVNDMPAMRLAAISRRSEEGEEQAGRWNCTWHKNWQDLVRDPEVDAVISVLPPYYNPAVAAECCAFKKPLLMEKPLAITYADAKQITRRCEATGTPLTVAQTLRYNSVIQGLKHNFNMLGKCFSFSLNQRLEPSTLSWLEDPELAGAGVILHTAVHLFDALRFITGYEIRRVRALSRKIYNPNLEDIVLIQVECSNGVCGQLDTSKITPARTGRFEFVGEHGILWGDQIYGKLSWLEGTRETKLTCSPPGPTIVTLLDEWYNFLTGNHSNPVSGKEGAVAVQACEACLRSVQSGNWEEL